MPNQFFMKSIYSLLLFLFVIVGYSQERKSPIFISADVGIGGGKTEFQYNVDQQAPGNELSTIQKREYSSGYQRTKLSVSVGYKYKNWGVGVVGSAGTQKNSEVTSRVTRQNGSTIKTEGAENWPSGKSYIGFFIEYNLPIADDILFAPRFDMLKYSHPSDQTFISGGSQVDSNLAYNNIFIDRNAIGVSAILKFYAKEGQYFFTGFKYVKDYYSISKEYIQETFSGFSSSQSQTSIIVGYQFSI